MLGDELLHGVSAGVAVAVIVVVVVGMVGSLRYLLRVHSRESIVAAAVVVIEVGVAVVSGESGLQVDVGVVLTLELILNRLDAFSESAFLIWIFFIGFEGECLQSGHFTEGFLACNTGFIVGNGKLIRGRVGFVSGGSAAIRSGVLRDNRTQLIRCIRLSRNDSLLHENRADILVVRVRIRLELVLLEDHEIQERVIRFHGSMEEVSLEFDRLILVAGVVPLVAVHRVELAFGRPFDYGDTVAQLQVVRVRLQFRVIAVVLSFKPASEHADLAFRVELLFGDETRVVLREIAETQDSFHEHVHLRRRALRHHHAFLYVVCREHVHAVDGNRLWFNVRVIAVDIDLQCALQETHGF